MSKVFICILASLAVANAGGYGGGSTSVNYGAGRGGVSHVSRKFGNPGGSGGYGAWAGSPIPADYEYTVHHGVSRQSYGGYGAGTGGWTGNSAGGAGYGASSGGWTGNSAGGAGFGGSYGGSAGGAWAGNGGSSGWY